MRLIWVGPSKTRALAARARLGGDASWGAEYKAALGITSAWCALGVDVMTVVVPPLGAVRFQSPYSSSRACLPTRRWSAAIPRFVFLNQIGGASSPIAPSSYLWTQMRIRFRQIVAFREAMKYLAANKLLSNLPLELNAMTIRKPGRPVNSSIRSAHPQGRTPLASLFSRNLC